MSPGARALLSIREHAHEVWQSATNNPHLAEERNLNLDDSGVNEEDKCTFLFSSDLHVLTAQHRYGAVVRGSNAYIPPGARKQQQQQQPSSAAASAINSPPSKTDIPKVSVNGTEGTVAAPKEVPPATKSTSPTPSTPSVNKVCNYIHL